MLSESLKTTLSIILSEKFSKPVSLEKSAPLGGGCINDAFRVESTAGAFFVKYNSARRYPGMFESEAKGLRLLHQGVLAYPEAAAGLSVPEVVGCGGDDQYSMLVLEFLESGTMQKDFWEGFGVGLAWLHRNSHSAFGLDHDNYIGSLPQSNRNHATWKDFFMVERLEAQLKMAIDNGRAGRELAKEFASLYGTLGALFPEEPPALLHGDLWSGNYMVGPQGKAAIVDPAVYYGHRYMDLGMSKLFGGFAPAFYEAYQAAWPLEKGWQEGIEVANLYPLMVHVNLFGGGYLGSVREILRRFRK